MVTIELALTEEQAWRLLERARRSNQTVSECVVALHEQIMQWDREEHDRRVARLLAAPKGHSGISDVSVNHDEYYVQGLEEEFGLRPKGTPDEPTDASDDHSGS